MNRKLVNGLLLLTVATAGCGTFTSCKDTDEDFKNEVILDQAELRAELLKLIEENKCDCPDYAKDVLEKLEAFLKDGDAYMSMDQALQKFIADYVANTLNLDQNDINRINDFFKDGGNYSTWGKSISTLQTEMNTLLGEDGKVGTIDDLKTRLATLEDIVGLTDQSGLQKQIADVLERLNSLNIPDGVTLPDNFNELMQQIGLNQTEINTINEGLTTYKNELNKKVEDLVNSLADYAKRTDLDAYAKKEALTTIENRLNALEPYAKAVDAIYQRLNSLITGIITQQTYNPIFGTINFPIGLQSNIVANYYGINESNSSFDFPTNVIQYNGDHSLLKKNEAIYSALLALTPKNPYGITTSVGPEDYYMSEDGDANLGTIYTTINPNNINFDGKTLDLVTSKEDSEKTLTVKVKKENDTELTFGYTKSVENNGFYRADVKITPEQAPKYAIQIESGLKSAAKDLLENRSAKDAAKLAKAIYDQLNGFMPAYALKAAWTAPEVTYDADGNPVVGADKEYAVYSNYNLGIATFAPLSYHFLYEKGIHSNPLPTFGPVSDAITEFLNEIRGDMHFDLDLEGINGLDPSKIEIKLNFKEIEVKKTTIEIVVDLAGITVDIPNSDQPGVVPEGQTLTITLGYDPEYGTVHANDESLLNPLIGQIVDQINQMLLGGDGDKSLEEQLNDQIKSQIIGQVNEMVANINKMLVGDGTPENPGMQGNINNQIQEMLDKIENRLKGKLSRVDNLIEKYNKLANKINDLIQHPNDYLQVVMAYDMANGGVGRLATDFNQPTRFVKGSGNAIKLYATSLTLDIVVPSYAKYVAVTRAWKNGAEAPALATKANEGGNLNTILPGRQMEVAIDANKLEAGVKYEILYTSIDYRGYASTNAYYLQVAQ